eukprot:jgi/Bigna1/67246/fgenesh1_pg.3_\
MSGLGPRTAGWAEESSSSKEIDYEMSTGFTQRPREGRIRRVIRRIRSKRRNKEPAGPRWYKRVLKFLGWSAEPAADNDVAAQNPSSSQAGIAFLTNDEMEPEVILPYQSYNGKLSTNTIPSGKSDSSMQETEILEQLNGPEDSLSRQSSSVKEKTATPLTPSEVTGIRWAEIGAKKTIRRVLRDSSELELLPGFLASEKGIHSLLNLEHIRAFDQLDKTRYRVYCGSFKLLSWYVEPVLDLEKRGRVRSKAARKSTEHAERNREHLSQNLTTKRDNSRNNDGSEYTDDFVCRSFGRKQVREQNSRFKANYRYRIDWGEDYSSGKGSTPFIQTGGDLQMQLQIYTFPFTKLPLSAVQGPGNKLMQALLRYLLPAFLDSFLEDFADWKMNEQGDAANAVLEAGDMMQQPASVPARAAAAAELLQQGQQVNLAANTLMEDESLPPRMT